MPKPKAWTVRNRDVLDLAACGEIVHFMTFFSEMDGAAAEGGDETDGESSPSKARRPDTATSVISASAASREDVVAYADRFGYTALHVAATHGHFAVCNILLQNGANVNAKTDAGVTPLHCAAQYGHLRVVNLLLEHGADGTAYTDRYELALGLAKEAFASHVVVLLEPLAAAKTDSEDALVAAAKGDMLYLLLQRLTGDRGAAAFATTTEGGDGPLHVVAKVGKLTDEHLAVARMLVSEKLVDVNGLNGQQMTPLMYAARADNLKLLLLLLRHGADATISSDENDASRTALSYSKSDRMRVLLDEAERRCEFDREYARRNEVTFSDRADFVANVKALKARWDEARDNHRVFCEDSKVEYVAV
jgi:ankyrin repeat protein